MAEECERCEPCRKRNASENCHYKPGIDIDKLRQLRNSYRSKESDWKIIERDKNKDDYTIDDIQVLQEAYNLRELFNNKYILNECLDCDYGYKNHNEALEYLGNKLRNIKRSNPKLGDYIITKDKKTKIRKKKLANTKKLEMTKKLAKTKKSAKPKGLFNKNETFLYSIDDIFKSKLSVKKKKDYIRQMENEKEREKTIEKMIRKATTDYKSKTFKILKRYSNLSKKRKLKLNTILDNATKKLEKKLLTQTFDIFKMHTTAKNIYKSIADSYETIKNVTLEQIDEDLSNIRINMSLLIEKIKELNQIINIFKNAKFKESKNIFEDLKAYLDILKNKLSSLIDFRKKFLDFQDLLKKTNGNIENDSLFMDYEYFKIEELLPNIEGYNSYIKELEEKRKKNLKIYRELKLKLKSNTVKLKKSFKGTSKKKTKRNNGNDKRKIKFEKIQKHLQEEYEHLGEYLYLLNEVNKLELF